MIRKKIICFFSFSLQEFGFRFFEQKKIFFTTTTTQSNIINSQF